MAEQRVKTRVQSKHDTEANWSNASFAPLAGEIIIYDKDADHDKQRVKVGDGETPLGDLPFIVDKEATDSILNTTIVGASVSGKVVTFTRADGTTFTITTQDTNTNTKVTNTKNNTSKAYITGTTSSATNTGTQIFNSNVYFDTATEGSGSSATTVNRVVADRFVGLATKATADASGNAINTTYETKTDANSKLSAALNHMAIVTENMNKEAHLTWGGKNHVASFGPIDAAMIPDLGANRLAFFPKEKVVLEYSRNGGSTWTTKISDSMKKGLFGNGTGFYIGDHSTAGVDKANYLCRVTITTTDTLYTVLNKFVIRVSTADSSGSYCTIEARTKANQDSNTNTWTKFVDKASIEGWPGWNVINISGLTTHGNTTSQYSQIRFTFGVETHASTSQYAGLSVLRIMAFGGVGWGTPSEMARTGHLYSYDNDQNATFPGTVSATQFTGALSGNATTATSATSATKATNDGNGNNIVNTYATKAELADELNPEVETSGVVTNTDTNFTLNLPALNSSVDPHNVLVEIRSPIADNACWRTTRGTIAGYIDTDTQYMPLDHLGSWYGHDMMSVNLKWLVEDSTADINSLYSTALSYTCCFTNDVAMGSTSGFVQPSFYDTPLGDFGSTFKYYLMFLSPGTNTLYFADGGYIRAEGSDGAAFCLVDGKVYLDTAAHGKLIRQVPSDFIFLAYMIPGHDQSGWCYVDFNYGTATLSRTTVILNTASEQLDSKVIDVSGEYPLRFTHCQSGNATIVINPAISNTTYKVRHLKASGNTKALKYGHSDTTIMEIVKQAFSSGTEDPNDSTPGFVYFKHL